MRRFQARKTMSWRLRMKVARIVRCREYGRFALTAGQIPPFSAFVPLDFLQAESRLVGRANLLCLWNGRAIQSAQDVSSEPLFSCEPRTSCKISSNVSDVTETSLPLMPISKFEPAETGGLELRSARVFLDPPIVAAAPPAKDGQRVEALTYFVNELRAGDNATPYSMVTAVMQPPAGFLPENLKDDEIAITQWLADDLGVAAGGEVTLKYFVMGERRQLIEKSRTFTVRAVLPMTDPQLNSSWMPDFPGLSDKKNCRDWKPGFDFDSTQMRDKDQQYWEKYRGTPKAFVNLEVGREMWGNRWGNITSIRWPAGTNRPRHRSGAASEPDAREAWLSIHSRCASRRWRRRMRRSISASCSSTSRSSSSSPPPCSPACSLSFRSSSGTRRPACCSRSGLRPRQVRRLFLAEGAVLALVGSVLGVVAGMLYTKAILWALSTVWRGAVGSVKFQFRRAARRRW